MGAEPCPHGMPTPGSCFDCMEVGNLAPPPQQEPERAVRVLSARFDGQCNACDLPVAQGELIALTTRERWIHKECLDG